MTPRPIRSRFGKLAPFVHRKLEHFNITNTRDKKILVNIVFSVLVKLSSLLILILPIPIMIHHLGAERFGVYSVIMGLMGIIMFADLGLGLGLQNMVAKCLYQENPDEHLKTNISTAFFSLILISITFAVITVLFNAFFGFSKVLNIDLPEHITEVNTAIFIYFFCFFLTIPGTVVQKVHAGSQRNYINSVWQFTGNVLSLVLIFLFAEMKLGLPYFVAATFGVSASMTVCGYVHFFVFKRPDLRPRLRYFSIAEVKPLFKVGFIFFLLQLFHIIGMTSDTVIISRFLGPHAVAMYAICFRVYQLMVMPMQIVVEPSFPAFNEALYANDFAWIRKTFRRMIALTSGWALLCFIVNFFWGKQLLHIWIKDAVIVPHYILMAFNVFVWQGCLSTAFSSILMSNRFLKAYLICTMAASIVSVSLKMLLVNKFEIAGVVYSSVAAYAVFFFLPASIYLFRYFSRTRMGLRAASANDGMGAR